MPDLFGRIAQEWPVIAAAPVTFVGVVSAAALIIWLALKWSYKSVLDGKNGEIASKASEIALLQRQRDDYKDKLSGASPDEAKAKIDDLERRLVLLEPRRLATEQRDAIQCRWRTMWRVPTAMLTPLRSAEPSAACPVGQSDIQP